MKLTKAVIGGLLEPPTLPLASEVTMESINESTDAKLKRLLFRIALILNKYKDSVAIGGTLALNIYLRGVVNTRDVDIFVLSWKIEELLKELKELEDGEISFSARYIYTFRFKDLPGVEANFLPVKGDPEESGIALSKPLELFGGFIKVMPIEFLVWSWLLSDLTKHEFLAEEVIKRRKVDLKKLEKYFDWFGDELAKERLAEVSRRVIYRRRRRNKVKVWKLVKLLEEEERE